ncbi:beta-phosphoglucomutase [Ornithinibacillus sp. L9]|uniref:Beta-phosphoglucomutase n=1 Tax=Ornithinibacillus caprae TaxID=2678566 RepID=A0A6N8FN11_9BACI|nr:beta-phosphoglucomutase [Ornithinibacillus caprae]MUK89427.1 beta-phosphoglucomutase [Ornithinibacillus caprae]
MKHLPKLFIFDLDGVITDTAEFHYLAWKKLGEKLGVSIDRNFNEQLKGISRMESLERILALDPSLSLSEEEKEILATDKNEYYKQLIETVNEEQTLPGVEVLLQTIKENNIKIALGSASKNASMVLEKLGLTNYFDYIVDAAKVKKGKPDPETFTTAADALSIAYPDCVGIEDAAAGVHAINDANMFSVGVGSMDHLAKANFVVHDTSKLDFEEIVQHFSNWKK